MAAVASQASISRMNTHRRLRAVKSHIFAITRTPKDQTIRQLSSNRMTESPRWQTAIEKALKGDSKSNGQLNVILLLKLENRVLKLLLNAFNH